MGPQATCEHSALITTITIVALSGIALLAISMLAHLQIIGGMNFLTQVVCYGIGGGLVVTSIISAVIFKMRSREEITLDLDNPEQLKIQLKDLCQKLIEGSDDPLKMIQKYADAIPLDKLESAIEIRDALKLAKRMLVEADCFLQARNSMTPSFFSRYLSIRNTVIKAIDSILNAFGVADFFKPSDSAIHADFKFQKIMMLISLFTLLTATLLPMLGVTTGASIVGGCMLLIAVASLIWPRIRPALPYLPSGINLSERIRNGHIWAPEGRSDVMSKMAEALKAERHVLLIGPSGIGKTQTAYAFTREAQTLFPGKTVFYFNAAELVASSDLFSRENSVLKRIEEIMGSNRDDYILIIDEIHVAFKEHEGNPFADKMKTFLDQMPNVIGMTTEEEYTKYIYAEHAAADRRFNEKIYITSTSQKETELALNYHLFREAPEVQVEKEAFQYLIKQLKEKPQPLSALGILSQCISKTKARKTPQAEAVARKKAELKLAGSIGAALGAVSLDEDEKQYDEIEQLEKELKALKGASRKEAEALREIAETKKRLTQTRVTKYRLVQQAKNKAVSRTKLSELLMIKYFLEPALAQRVCKLSHTLQLESVITKTMIDTVIAEDMANQNKRQEAIERSRKEAEARQS